MGDRFLAEDRCLELDNFLREDIFQSLGKMRMMDSCQVVAGSCLAVDTFLELDSNWWEDSLQVDKLQQGCCSHLDNKMVVDCSVVDCLVVDNFLAVRMGSLDSAAVLDLDENNLGYADALENCFRFRYPSLVVDIDHCFSESLSCSESMVEAVPKKV